MRRSAHIVALVSVVLAGGAVAAAHDADQSATGRQPHRIGPYQVLDEVEHHFSSETTLASYTVTAAPGAQASGHVTLGIAACSPAHQIVDISQGGEVVAKGDPSTGTPGPVVKWNTSPRAGETRTYSYRVKGLFEPEETELVLKSGKSFRGPVQRTSCNRMERPCTLTGPEAIQPKGGGTAITVELRCTRPGDQALNFGFPERANDQGPLVELTAAAGGVEVLRVTDRLFDSGSEDRTTHFRKEILLRFPVDEVCVTLLGQEKCVGPSPQH